MLHLSFSMLEANIRKHFLLLLHNVENRKKNVYKNNNGIKKNNNNKWQICKTNHKKMFRNRTLCTNLLMWGYMDVGISSECNVVEKQTDNSLYSSWHYASYSLFDIRHWPLRLHFCSRFSAIVLVVLPFEWCVDKQKYQLLW